ncbi:polysaccharide lyase [Pseudonocardia bannensis]|uniref:Polysaccharide lyase-like protein n=1 Tax=Pseudonocardia bannensis TaxID=630973 RepID=A0A848DE11_9PSEU|nr:polysaccharide lyase [Pseudonocardia bannensis]NMH90860.1 hypothetical protein [Pseudonocardia bannensis]
MRVRATVPLFVALALALSGCAAVAPQVAIEHTAATHDLHARTLPDLARIEADIEIGAGAAPAPAAAVPVGSRVLFVGGYDTGDFRQWATCQWRNYNASCARWGQTSYAATVRNDGPGHETAARFEVRRGDIPPFGGGERAEVSANGLAGPTVREGDERWYEFSLKFDATYRPPTKGGYSIVMQWHSGSGSPPLHLDVDDRGRLLVWHPWDNPSVIGPIDAGRWHSYVVHAKFSRSAMVGFVEVWRDGRIAVPKRYRANMTSASNYLKMGLYRDIEQHTQVVWHDGLRITAP